MPEYENILVVQTAFVGDVILTLPMIQVVKRHFPSSSIDVVTVPRAAELLANHPAVNNVIIYDKRGKDSGIGGFLRMLRRVQQHYQLALVPHRSLRSAALARLAGIPRRVGFDRSAGRMLFTDPVQYDPNRHEIERNLSLLQALGINAPHRECPQLFPSYHDRKRVTHYLTDCGLQHAGSLVAVAPGTVWNTKRWLFERYHELVRKLVGTGYPVVLIGGRDDVELCERIERAIPSRHVISFAGKFTLLQSAELIRRCRVLVGNDSAPVHLAAAMCVPVVAIFGATVPEFGFGPYGEHDIIVEVKGLPCRPCSVHGGEKCPIKTFDCMKKITLDMVYDKVIGAIQRSVLEPTGHS